MNEIVINEIQRYCTDRLKLASMDVQTGKEKEKDPFYARFWEGRLVADTKHEESLNHILKLIEEGVKA